jgi:hypothetical protein
VIAPVAGRSARISDRAWLLHPPLIDTASDGTIRVRRYLCHAVLGWFLREGAAILVARFHATQVGKNSRNFQRCSAVQGQVQQPDL